MKFRSFGDMLFRYISRMGSDLVSSVHRTFQRDLVRIFEITADGTPFAILLTFIPIGDIIFERYIAVVSPSTVGFVASMTSDISSLRSLSASSAMRSLSGPDMLHRRYGAVEDMIQPSVCMRSFDRNHRARILNHAQRGLIPLRIGAYPAKLMIRHIKAPRTFAHIGLGADYRIREFLCRFIGEFKNGKCKPHRPFCVRCRAGV